MNGSSRKHVWYFIPQALGYNCHSGEEQPGLLSLEEPWPMVQKPCRDFLKKNDMFHS